jgi:hypothetical protein
MKKKALLLMLVLMFISTNALSQSWIQGQITGDIQAGISVSLYKNLCGSEELVDTVITNSAGYYWFECLDAGDYKVVPDNATYIFNPAEIDAISIPQTVIQSYDFTATEIAPTCDSVDRFLDNGDGTVTDCRTDLIWLQNANCYSNQTWATAMSSAAGLNSGECGLTDGSAEEDWRLPTKDELQGIGTDPPSVAWTMPGLPFVSVLSLIYWSSTEYSFNMAWGVGISAGGEGMIQKVDDRPYVWPVRSDN